MDEEREFLVEVLEHRNHQVTVRALNEDQAYEAAEEWVNESRVTNGALVKQDSVEAVLVEANAIAELAR